MFRLFLIFFFFSFYHATFSQSNIELDEFMEACEKGNISYIKNLISSGLKLNAKSDSGKTIGKTPLMWASIKGKRDIVRLLIENGADINAKEDATGSIKRQSYDGWTALLYAADSDHEEVVKVLVMNGADVNVKSKTGTTAISLARLWQNEDMIRILKNAGALE